jgi:hypothetical protein
MFTSIGQGNRFSGFIGDRDSEENMVDRLQRNKIGLDEAARRNA